MNKRERITKLCNMFCAVVLVVLIVLQFMPFWYSVGGVHKTKDEYLAWSETYIPVAERPTEAKPTETTAAATEATTVAPTETEPAATEPAATEGEKDNSGRPGRPNRGPNTAPKDPLKAKEERAKANDKSAAVRPTAPPTIPTDPEIKVMSIASSVWRTNTYKKDQAAPLLMFHVAILGFGAVALFFCIAKRKNSINCIWVLATAILGTIGYFTNAAAQTGMAWMVHGATSAVLLIPGILLLVFWIKDLIDWFTKVEA